MRCVLCMSQSDLTLDVRARKRSTNYLLDRCSEHRWGEPEQGAVVGNCSYEGLNSLISRIIGLLANSHY